MSTPSMSTHRKRPGTGALSIEPWICRGTLPI
jgi:hypothetical protein